MAKLVEANEIYAYLGVKELDDPNGVILDIRDSVEDLLCTMTGREFLASTVYVDEQYDGWGTDVIYVKRPLSTLTAIKFRYYLPTDQPYNLDVATLATWRVGGRRIALRSWINPPFIFPLGRDNILISYTSQDDKPALAKQAVREAVATLYRRIGSEDARSEQIGTFQHVLLRNLDESMSWKKAVDLLTIPTLG